MNDDDDDVDWGDPDLDPDLERHYVPGGSTDRRVTRSRRRKPHRARRAAFPDDSLGIPTFYTRAELGRENRVNDANRDRKWLGIV